MAMMKVGKSINQINAQADRLIELSVGNEARMARINEIRERYLKNIYMTAYHRKFCQDRDMYANGKDIETRHNYFEACRRINTYTYGFTQYTHIQTRTKGKKRVKLVRPMEREDMAILEQMKLNGQEPIGRDAIKEMRAIVKLYTKERTAQHKERSKANKAHRAEIYKNRGTANRNKVVTATTSQQ